MPPLTSLTAIALIAGWWCGWTAGRWMWARLLPPASPPPRALTSACALCGSESSTVHVVPIVTLDTHKPYVTQTICCSPCTELFYPDLT